MFSEKKARRRLTSLSIVLCLLPVTILYFINEKKSLDSAQAEQAIENSQITSLVAKELAKMEQTVLLLSHNPAWEKYYTEPERRDYWKAEQIKAFQYVKEEMPETDKISFLDDLQGGAEVVRLDKRVAHEHELSVSEKAQPFYRRTIYLKRGEVYQSEPYISPDSRRWVFGNATPIVIREEGIYKEKTVGILHYEVNVTSLSSFLTKHIEGNATAFVMSEKGNLIASSSAGQAQLIRKTAGNARKLASADFAEFQKAASLPMGRVIANDPVLWQTVIENKSGFQIVKINNKRFLLSFEEVEVENNESWIVGMIKPAPKFSFFSASNFLMYVMLVVIVLVIIGAKVIVNRILKEIRASQQQLSRLAHFDTLTELPNRVLFLEQLTELIQAGKKKPGALSAVLFVDLDRFKIINDTMGHATGDRLLKEVAGRLQQCVGPADTVARFGGDEFVILLRNIQSRERVAGVATQINELTSLPFMLQGNEYFINTSIGISLYPDNGTATEALIKHADLAMYHAKESGGSCFVFFEEKFNSETVRRLKLETNLRKAIENEEFQLFYQPKVQLPAEKIVGMEALIRWNHPEIGMIAPGEFIPIAEETGLIKVIGDWVLHAACEQNKKWQREGHPPVVISVNISAYQFQYGNIEKTVKAVLEKTGLDAKWLELELTESLFMNNEEIVIKTLRNLKEIGVKISIDDFGTGYSSFSYLKRFPIDTLKIDQSFIKDIFSKSEDQTITKAIITMGHSLNCTIVAEGVETEQQHSLLHSYNCDQIQGYYYSPPAAADKMTAFIKTLHGKQLKKEDIKISVPTFEKPSNTMLKENLFT